MDIWELAHEYEIQRDGGWIFDPVRVTGIYATEGETEVALERASSLPGFAETVNDQVPLLQPMPRTANVCTITSETETKNLQGA